MPPPSNDDASSDPMHCTFVGDYPSHKVKGGRRSAERSRRGFEGAAGTPARNAKAAIGGGVAACFTDSPAQEQPLRRGAATGMAVAECFAHDERPLIPESHQKPSRPSSAAQALHVVGAAMAERATVLEQAQHFTFSQGGDGQLGVPTAKAVGGRRKFEQGGAQSDAEYEFRSGRRAMKPAAPSQPPGHGRRHPPAQALDTRVGASLRDYVPPPRSEVVHAAPISPPPPHWPQGAGLPLEDPFLRRR